MEYNYLLFIDTIYIQKKKNQIVDMFENTPCTRPEYGLVKIL